MGFSLDFYTSHNQFYIFDKASNGNTGSDRFWTEDAYNDRLAIEDGILGVGTECYGPIKGEVTILTTKKEPIEFDLYDHIVEGGIEIKSGTIQILDCPSSEVHLELNVKPGFYRTRIYSINLASVNGDEGEDSYRIEIWSASEMERKVLKRYS
ncbi:MAG: hypothetical protein ABIN13_08260 [Mucilaginibacter sp.]